MIVLLDTGGVEVIPAIVDLIGFFEEPFLVSDWDLCLSLNDITHDRW
jgi:hypothetical protein